MPIAGSKPSVNEEIVRYQGRTKLALLADQIAGARRISSPETQAKIKQAKMIRLWLKALDYKNYLTREQREKIWYSIIDIADVNDFPTAPLLEQRDRPNILVGIQGPPGPPGTNIGGGTNFNNSDIDIGSEDCDTFAISLAEGAVWHYTITNGTAYRSGIVTATWSVSTADCSETSTPDVGGSTDDVTLNVDVNSGNVRLRATSTSNNWQIYGTRYLINP
jgi:hypothetical protein